MSSQRGGFCQGLNLRDPGERNELDQGEAGGSRQEAPPE